MFFLFSFLFSFIITFFSIPLMIDRLKSTEHTLVDRYKFDMPSRPNHGAIVVIFIAILSCSIIPLLNNIGYKVGLVSEHFMIQLDDISLLLVICIFGLFGVIDDFVKMGWWPKIFFPMFFTFPLLIVYSPQFLEVLFFGNFDLSTEIAKNITYEDLFKFFIAPIYVMVVANLVNMHSGFNGLQSGLSCILLFSIIVKSYIDESTENNFVAICFLGGMVAFWFYNRYPARIFEGNIGSLAFGALIGSLIVIKEYYIFGMIILLPHIFDFLLFIYLRISDKPFVKFGSLNEDGTINAPNPIKLKFLFPYYFRLTEKQSVNICLCITTVFCILGILL